MQCNIYIRVYFSKSVSWNSNEKKEFFDPDKRKVFFDLDKEELGLLHCKIIVVGADPIPSQTLDYFLNANIPLLVWYGTSESTGPQTANIRKKEKFKRGSCGQSINGVKTKICKADDLGRGEVSDMLSDLGFNP